MRTTTARTTSPGLTSPPGIAFLTLQMMTSPRPAYRRRVPPSTLMHMHSLAPVLSATSTYVYIWIIGQTVPGAAGVWASGGRRLGDLHLDRGLGNHPQQPPALLLGQRPGLHDLHRVA